MENLIILFVINHIIDTRLEYNRIESNDIIQLDLLDMLIIKTEIIYIKV